MADYTEELKKATEQHAEKERNRLIIDFDEALREQESNTIIVKFDGDEYELPDQPPAWLPIFINRHTHDGVVDDDANLEVVERLLGKELASKIMNGSNFVSFSMINDKILSPVFDHWGMSLEDESGKVKTPS